MKAWSRQPFVGLALAAGAGVLIADYAPNPSSVLAASLALLGILALVSRHSVAVYAFVAAGFFFLHSERIVDSPGSRLAHELGEQPRPVTVRGSVVTEPKVSAKESASFLLQIETIEIDGQVQRYHTRFFTRWRHAVEFGDEIQLFGTAEAVARPRNPGEFDMRSYLARQDVHRELIVRYSENGVILKHGGGNRILRAAQKSRGWMQRTLCRNLEDSPEIAGLISGMVLGLRRQTPEDIEEPFQQTGTLHLFAVAGLHVGIVARLLWILASVVRLPRKWATALIIPALLFYAAITGLHTSSVRAAVMSAVLFGGFLVERKAFAFNSLAAAAILILGWDTNELFSVGFQLSFCVVAAILLLAEPSFAFLRRHFSADPFLPRSLFGIRQKILGRIGSWLARGSAVSFAAWVGSLPLMLWYYHLVTLVSLLANLVVVPLAFFVLAGGLMSMVAAPISTWLSVVFNNANWLLSKMILLAVHLFAQFPGGHFYVEHPHWPTGARVDLTSLDLRSGAAVHVRTSGKDWLLDAGGIRDYDRSVRPYLRSKGVNWIDGLILSHGDAGHIGGASGILLDFHPREVIDTAAPDRSTIHHQFKAEIARRGTAVRSWAAGDEVRLSSEVTGRILFPPRGFAGETADDQALVIQLLVAGQPRILFMSDSGIATEQFVLKEHPDLRTDIVIKGQHRSGNSGSPAFLEAVQPKVVIATSRDFPESERIKDEWVEDLRGRGIKLFRQDETGAVQIRIFRDHWEATTYVTSELFRSTTR